jgi:hypothetical protein
MENAEAYFARRARQEQAAAEKARSSAAHEMHVELARRYQELADLEHETSQYMEVWASPDNER